MDPARLAAGPKTLYLIDANNLLFRAYHALPMLNASDGTPVNAVHGCVRMINAVRRDQRPEYFAAVFDGGRPSFRNEIYPEYKANRPEPPDDLVPQFALVREALDAMSIPRIERPGVEADDIIATLSDHAKARGIRTVIVSSDKDLMQLVSDTAGEVPSVHLLDTMKSIAIGPEEVQERFGVPPAKLGDLLALAGDSSDNIPGVPGIGPKTAAALLAEFGDLAGVLQNASGLRQKKRRDRLIEHAQDARLSRRLVELRHDCDVPELEELRDPQLDTERARAFFERWGFRTVLKELGAPTAPVVAAVPVTGARDSEGAIELGVVDGFEAGATPRVILAADAPALRDLAGAAKKAGALTVQLVLSAPDPMVAEVVGVALGVPEGAKVHSLSYVPVGHDAELGDAQQLGWAQVVDILGEVLGSSDIAKTLADHKQQVLVIERHGAKVRGVTMDPVLASYVLDPARTSHEVPVLSHDILGHACATSDDVRGRARKQRPFHELGHEAVARYAGERVECVTALGFHLAAAIERAGEAVHRLYHEVEMPLARVLEALERRGIQLDTAVLATQSRAIEGQIEAIRQRIGDEVGHEVNLDSPIQLQKVLFEERGLPPLRKTKTGFSTDARVLEELSVLDPIVKEIIEYRILTKLKSTYLDALPALVNRSTKRLHTVFHQTVAQTGRLSSSDPNLQNIPIRSEHGRRIREAFVAPPGRRLVALDYSQIELRVLAHLSGDPNLRSAFIEDVDVHRRTAAEVFEVPEDQVTPEQRRIAKAVNFGVIYGQTAFGLAQQLGIPRGKAGIYIKAYFEKIPGVEAYMNELVAQAKRRGFSETVLGRQRRIPELRAKGARRAHGERMARNTPIQGSAADILKLAMIAVEGRLAEVSYGEMLLTVHDELIFECDEDRVDDLVGLARPAMEEAFQLDVPLKVEAGHGRTWAECKGGA